VQDGGGGAVVGVTAMAVDVLSELLSSVVALVTWMVLETIVPAGVPPDTWRTIEKLAPSPGFRLGIEQVIVPTAPAPGFEQPKAGPEICDIV
jgi:hypothetical protein